MGLCSEYTRRYDKVHKSQKVIEWCNANRPELPTGSLTEHPKCMPDHCKTESVVESYRQYYVIEKSYFAQWKDGNIPEWYLEKTV